MRTRLAGGGEVEVTTGGSHWGGGLWLTGEDLARYGQLQLRGGEWDGRRVLSEEWCRRQLVPTHARRAYGLMWWRNPEAGIAARRGGLLPARRGRRRARPSTPAPGVRGFAAHGTGEQIVWCDPDRDLVAVVRWVDRRDPGPRRDHRRGARPPPAPAVPYGSDATERNG